MPNNFLRLVRSSQSCRINKLDVTNVRSSIQDLPFESKDPKAIFIYSIQRGRWLLPRDSAPLLFETIL